MKQLIGLSVFVLGLALDAGFARELSSLPLMFEQDNGAFLARGNGFTLVLEEIGARLQTRHGRLDVRLVDARKSRPRPEQPLSGTVNYIRGDRSLTGIRTFGRVRYSRVYPGIDLVYYGNDSQLEYDFVIAPGGDPGDVVMEIRGAEGLRIDDEGNLLLKLGPAELVQHRPILYQDARGGRTAVTGKYRLIGNNRVAFEVGTYDRNRILIIDPILSYSTFLGGSDGDDDGRAIATDSTGAIYVTGATTATNFTVSGGVQPRSASDDPGLQLRDAFITKLNAAGTAVVYSTYLGGSGDDVATALAVDLSGNVVVVGHTASTNFPTTAGAIRRTCNAPVNSSCLDAFAAKLNAAGNALTYSTYLGDAVDDEGRGVALDSIGNAYVAATAFVMKLSPSGASMYNVSVGTAGAEIRGIAVDSLAQAYITGSTPATTSTGTDLFVMKLGTSGSVVYQNYMRGTRDDSGNSIAVDSSGGVYVTGRTSSIDFRTTAGAYQTQYAGGPLFRSSDAGSTWAATQAGLTRTSFFAIVSAPSSPATLYAGADDGAAGGLYKSTNAGANWAAANTGLTDSRIHALAIDPTSANTVYAGTRSAGVFKTTNGGALWTATTLNTGLVASLVIDPANTGILYAGLDGGGVYKSTNAGASWTAINNGLDSLGVRAIAIHPTLSSTVFAGAAGGVYRSTNSGTNWTPIGSASSGLFDPNINALAIDPRNPNVIYAGTASAGVFRTTNGGLFWFPSNTGVTSTSFGIQVTALVVDPNSGMLFAAVGEANASRLIKSATGTAWTLAGLSSSRITAIAVDPTDSSRVYAATVGGDDAFVAKWDVSGALVYSTYLGGYRDDAGNGIAVDPSGSAYVVGDTGSANLPTVGAIQSIFANGADAGTDVFVTKLGNTGARLSYATYLGGSSNDLGKGIAIDPRGNAYITGQTSSPEFPTAASVFSTRPGLLDAFVAKIGDTSTAPYAVSSRGGYSSASQGGGNTISVGYGRITPATGASTSPAGLAIFGFRRNNVLVSEAAVPASALLSSGRIYAEVAGAVNTGIAIANPNNETVSVTFYFTDAGGQNSVQSFTDIAANNQLAAFLNEAPFNRASGFQGTFTFAASAPVAVIALRGYSNERDDFLITTLPVVDLSLTTGSGAVVFPHFADGGGWTTQFVLVNTGSDAISGRLEFPAAVTLDGETGFSFNYAVPGRTSRRFSSAGAASSIQGGSVRVAPAAGSRTPSGVAIFSFRNAGTVVSEAGVPALGTATAFRMYAEYRGNFNAAAVGSMQTGVAIGNTSSSPAVVNFELTTLDGTSTGLTGSMTIPANGQRALFLDQITGFAAIPNPLQGILRASTTSTGVSMIGLRGRYNENRDFLITTTQPVVESSPAATGEMYFPHFADGGGYTTQFILFNGGTDQSSSGVLRFFGQRGDSLSLSVR